MGFETLTLVLELAAAAAAASDCLWMAMLGRWMLQWASRVAMSPSRMTKIAAIGKMKPSRNLSYRVKDLHFDNVAIFLIK